MSFLSSPIIGQHFAYAHGRLGVLQQNLLSKTDLDRMLGAHDTKEFEQILIELKLTTFIDQGIRNSDELISATAMWIRKEVKQMAPASKQPVFNILWMSGDLPLIAYLLKKHHGFTSNISIKPESGMGAYDSTILEQFIKNGSNVILPSHLTQFIDKVKSIVNPTPKNIDTAVAAYGAETQLRLARAGGSKEILKFVRHTIDISNIRTALRLIDSDSKSISTYLIDGGTINTNLLAKPLNEIKSNIAKSDLSYFLSDALDNKEIPDANVLEQSFAELKAADIAQMWNIPLSIEPLFAFASLALWDLMLIKIILIGKRNGLSPQEIKHALPPFLSASHYVL